MKRKLKKLIKNPKMFILDSKLTNKGLSTKNNSTPKAQADKRPLSITSSENHMFFRDVNTYLKKDTQHDCWQWYKSKLHNFNEIDTLIFPSTYINDSYIYERLVENGFKPGFLPLWEISGNDKDIDDIEYISRKKPSILVRYNAKIIDLITSNTILHAFFSYDSTTLTRNALLTFRQFNIPTSLFLTNLKAIEHSYLSPKVIQIPIADNIITSISSKNIYDNKFNKIKSNVYYVKDNGKIEHTNKNRELLCSLGIGKTDDIITIIPPALQLNMADDEIKNFYEKNIQEKLKEKNQHLHIIIFLRDKKESYLTNVSKGVLKDHVRKTFFNLNDVSSTFLTSIIGASKSTICVDDIFYHSINFMNNVNEPLSMIKNYQSLDCHVQRSIKIIDRIIDRKNLAFDVVAVPDPIDNKPITEGRQKYITSLLNCKRRIYGAGRVADVALADLFIQWGAEPNEAKSRPEYIRSALGRSKIYVEDGFVRSVGLWTDVNEPTLSVTLDTDAIYYNSLHEPLLQKILNNNYLLSNEIFYATRNTIERITTKRISKYNYAPSIDISSTGSKCKRRILLIDQKSGDMSIKYGMADSSNFKSMLDYALSFGDNAEIFIKLHPCAINGEENEAHFTVSSLGDLVNKENIHLISFDINPYSLMESMDEVCVVSSGMGFEALMAGKDVTTFGVSFYSHRGLTKDMAKCLYNRRECTLEEIFYWFYERLTAYYNPDLKRKCTLNELIDYILEKRPVQ
ncbi:capsular polysaccharide export protein, LipB/KpsS family [Aeromonas veronii]|uniref:capsular polysaccharide export protein, LipB/KpsS family n=1 Tax=Aeromonas veronii TaxID=654 RepID=UPI0038B4B2D3